MKITDVSLRRPVTVLIATAALVLFGLMALGSMGVQRIPDVDLPVVVVSTTMSGASPEVMDNDVTDVIEEKLSTISGIEAMRSNSYEGKALTILEFDLNRDVDAAAADVRDKVNLAVADLPDDADSPVVQKFTIGDEPIVTVAVTGSASYREKVHFADKVVSPRFQSVNGVGDVDMPGLREREIRIWLDPARLEARDLTVSDIKDAISEKHVELPAGRVETALNEYELRLQGEYVTVEELQRLPLVSVNGAIVRLEDVARVEDGFEERRTLATYNGDEVILLGVRKQRGANEVSMAQGVMEKLEQLRRDAPPGITLEVVDNQADFVRASMKGAQGDVVFAVALCSLIMLFFLRTFRATFVTVVAIPVCLLGSFILLKSRGITVNNLTMMGISLAVGLVVDSTTVVLENVHRHLEEGMAPRLAASQGTSEVAFSVLAGAATTIAVFAPVAFMGGIIGRFFYNFGITVVATIALSLLLSLTLTPYLCSRVLRRDHPGRIARSVEAFLEALEGGYRRTLRGAVAHRGLSFGAAVALFAAGLVLVANVGTGFFPSEDRGDFTISFELPAGTSMAEMERFLGEMDGMVRARDDVRYTYATVGSGMGGEINKGDLVVKLIPRSERLHVNDIMRQMRRDLSIFRDAKLTLATWGGADLALTLVGDDTASLVAIADPILGELKADGRLTDIDTDVRLDKPRLNIEINRERTDDLDISVRDLSQEIQAYFGGVKSGVFKEGGYRYDIRLMAEGALRSSPSDIENIAVRSGQGQLVRVPGLVDVRPDLSVNVVKRYDRRRSLTIEANATDIPMGQGMELVLAAAGKHLPDDGSVAILPTGRAKHMKENFHYLFIALATAIVLVYMVMAVQFESFLHPFTVMFSLPLLTPGAFGILYLTGMNLDLMSFMGIILLVGIVVNNAILLVDFINQRREAGEDKVTAVLAAGPMRLRPILMTALSTVVGSLPVALGLSEGSEFRQPLSTAVVGGLLTSTFLTLYVIPVVYLILDDIRDRVVLLARFARARLSRRSSRRVLAFETEKQGGKQ
ncbi:efflux RND transporter permease subunit [Aminirod propionatiphilus]|uniref:Efflux RND transporter permease subunit n=1 Tax=Aminirod propionatiphilus TaxID=3415223 RepID=A0ACD1DUW1_9BACT|nr:efflux RND transporter permease subunit [Synergistota bacterium]